MIVNANPEIFDENYEEGCEDWEQLTLTLALLFEIIKVFYFRCLNIRLFLRPCYL